MTTDHLRTIAVTVEESERGVFHWLLVESIDDPNTFTELFGSAESFANWEEALDGGIATLKGLVGDRTVGPRLTAEDDAPEPSGRRARRVIG